MVRRIHKSKIKIKEIDYVLILPKLLENRIYAIRTSKHMSRKDLAKRSGLHLTYIGQLERGERNATIATLESVFLRT